MPALRDRPVNSTAFVAQSEVMDMANKEYGESWGLATSPTLVEEKFEDFSNTFSKEKDVLNFQLTKVCASPGCDTCHGNINLETHLSRENVEYEMLENYSVSLALSFD